MMKTGDSILEFSGNNLPPKLPPNIDEVVVLKNLHEC